jgi:hypothetical protein
MKSIHPLAMGVRLCILLALVLSVSSVSAGMLHFKMTAPKTTLAVGEEVTITVSAWVDDATSGNGLNTWQLDLSVNNTGVIGITKTGSVADITLLAPTPYHPMFSGWSTASVNSPVSGEVRSVAVMQYPLANPSAVGVGGYTDIFSFNIQAMSVGTASYTICDDGGGLFYGCLVDDTEYDNTVPSDGGVVFDSGSSNRTFTVVHVPEPMSLTIFALAGSLAVIRRKK